MAKDSNCVIEFDYSEEKYDESNPLVIVPKKRKLKTSKIETPTKKPLSNKERKKLEKIVQQKEKKISRTDLWNELKAEQYKTFSEVEPAVTVFTQNKSKERKNKQPTEVAKSWKISKAKEESSTDTDEYSTDDDTPEPSPKRSADNEKSPSPTDTSMDTEITSQSDKHQSLSTHSDTVKPPVEQASCDTSQKYSTPRFVLVNRSQSVIDSRLQLPILGEEQTIMEQINENDVVVLCGATGCGKTTQLPQFLYEAGFTRDGMKIGVTEPRRVAAISMSQRVAYELNLNSRKVSYQIRYEGNATADTEIKFMTDGVLLQEIKQDFELKNYSCVLVDEAHERSVFTDILLGLLSLIVKLRRRKDQPLKLVIMSATMRVDDFVSNTRLFGSLKPSLMEVPSRQHPVTCHFNKTTHPDYLRAAYRKVCKIHGDSPPGGILVFVTGQQEVHILSKWLRSTFPNRPPPGKTQDSGQSTEESEAEDIKIESKINLENYSIIPLDEESEVALSKRKKSQSDDVERSQNKSADSDRETSSDEEDLEDPEDMDEEIKVTYGKPLFVLPLYSLLPADKQARVFEEPPENFRLVVIATNVAETSITIPNVKYVVDTGKVKQKVYDKVTGVSSFHIVWTSKASAEQRAGRAGRTSPGHCYRLYSSRVFMDEFADFTPPEITERPIEDIVLMLKSYLGATKFSRFPLPTAPSEEAVSAAEEKLVVLGALDKQGTFPNTQTVISRVGRWISRLPLTPRFSKMLLLSNHNDLLPYTVLLVATLSVPELFVHPSVEADDENDSKKKDEMSVDPLKEKRDLCRKFRQQFVKKENELLLGDPTVLLGTICTLEAHAVKLNSDSAENDAQFRAIVERHGVRMRAYKEVKQLRKQITDILNVNVPNLNLSINPCLPKPTSEQLDHLRQILLAGSPFHVARKYGEDEIPALLSKSNKFTKKALKYAYQCDLLDEPVFIHPESVLFREKYEFVIFQELHCTAKPYMRCVTVIDSSWLSELVPGLCHIDSPVVEEGTVGEDGKPLESPSYDSSRDQLICQAKKITFGRNNWPLDPSVCRVPMSSLSGVSESIAVRWFARHLLEGKIIPNFADWRDKMKSTCPPKLTTMSWGMIRPHVRNFINELSKLRIFSRECLEERWKVDKNYLYNAFSAWIKDSEKLSIQMQWPPISKNISDNKSEII